MTKKTIAVFFGGQSTEHDISIITAISAVMKPLRLTGKYDVIPVYITKSGRWVSDKKLADVSLYRGGALETFLKKAKPVAVTFDGGFRLNKRKIDVAFPAMHGTYGEDGSLMGLLRLANVPFVGADMDASVIAMDKVLAKQVATANSIPTSQFVFFTRQQVNGDVAGTAKLAMKTLSFPLFVKPAHLGSSIGITRATKKAELENALEVAAHYDEKIIVEEAVGNLIEVTVPIMGNEEPVAALVERPLTQADDFFDFETKYLNGGGKKGGKQGSQGYSQLPAELPGKLYDESVKTALAVYKAVGITGFSRVDLLIDSKAKKVYFNEINPLPGSLYAHNWRAAGVPTVQLVERLISFAEERFVQRARSQSTFDSNFLQQF